MNSKQLRKWLEDRGVVVVTTRTRKSGVVSATSCFSYGQYRSHIFYSASHMGVVIGASTESGRELVVESWSWDFAGKIEKSPDRKVLSVKDPHFADQEGPMDVAE